jgi:hypothetical protein
MRSEWRWPAAALLAEVAAVHIALVPAHLRDAPYAGAVFIALSAASIGVALLIAVSDQRRAWAAAGGLAAGALVAYVISRSVGLPMMSDDLGDWLNPLGIGAVCAEAITVAICSGVLLRPRSVSIQAARGPRVSPLASGSA